MCNDSSCNNSVCFIIPAHMLEYISLNAKDARLRERIVKSLHTRGCLQGMRDSYSLLVGSAVQVAITMNLPLYPPYQVVMNLPLYPPYQVVMNLPPSPNQVIATLLPAQSYPTGESLGYTLRRTIFDEKNSTTLRGALVRSEGQEATDDPDIDDAYDNSGKTYDFYKSVFNHFSVDNKAMGLISSVHYGDGFDNAFWSGQQMVYGDGDGEIFGRFTSAIEVVGHELTHGVTQFTANLQYQGQSGALNESMSDVFGVLIKQYDLKQTADQADWLVGQGLLIPSKTGGKRDALRSMKAPGTAYDDPDVLGKDPQPSHMNYYKDMSDDNGGIHINSGIPNHAFYLAATKIGGYAWEKAGHIWYEVLTQRLRPTSQFADAARETRDVAKKYGDKVAAAVDEAWTAVGLKK
ncbi:bacillolysin [Candidatus Magnetobacterium bavaricum]|uniref:Neutral metalloproteinase n=1 Tax=Candidatus Magnetobacterium bavaricum TaxID=29290 RepID=A0A0F3GX22_9BACT|nr:bacillolysin [Candidatus Magnetobacterium bavaricum]